MGGDRAAFDVDLFGEGDADGLAGGGGVATGAAGVGGAADGVGGGALGLATGAALCPIRLLPGPPGKRPPVPGKSVSSTLVERVDACRVRAVSHFQVVRIMHSGESLLFATGRYLDVIRLDGDSGKPQFEAKIVVCDSRRFDTLLAIPL
jgi:hypothetical protein